MSNRAVLYGRVSTDEQIKGTSLDDQVAGNTAKAHMLKAEIAATFEDVESGGYYLTRKGLQDALRYLEEGKANIIIAKDLDRLTRNSRPEQALIFERIKKAGARVVYWTGEHDDSPLGEFAQNITGDFAILEKAVIRQRTMRGRVRRAEEGIMPSRAIAPYGYILPTKADVLRGIYPPDQLGKYQLHPERAPIAEEIFKRYESGESLHAICRWLQCSGVPRVAGGRCWNPCNITTMLDNPCYHGLAAFGRFRTITDETRRLRGLKERTYKVPVPEEEWIRIPCPDIVTKDLWERCHQAKNENRVKLSARTVRRQMLTGMMRCPRCRRVMLGRGKRFNSVAHYYCKESSATMTSIGVICWKKHLNANRIEALVINAVKAVVKKPMAVEAAYKHYYSSINSDFSQQEYDRLKKELGDSNREETATVRAQIAGVAAGANTAVYEGILRDISSRRAQIQAKIEAFDKAHRSTKTTIERADLIAAALSDVEEVLDATEDHLPTAKKNSLLRKVIKDIYPDEDSYSLTITFKTFDDGTNLIACCSEGQEPEFRVVTEVSVQQP